MNEEHEHQKALFHWAKVMENQHPELALLYANPLGGYRPKRTAAKMKAEGVKAGVPDITLPVARHGYHGLYIELKTERGRVTPEQRQWMWALYQQGYLALVCRGWEHARDLLLTYLDDSDPAHTVWMEDYKPVVGEK